MIRVTRLNGKGFVVNAQLTTNPLPMTVALGSVRSGVLEASNVDFAQEFTNLIVSQRAFQANARVITTADDLLEELVNIV